MSRLRKSVRLFNKPANRLALARLERELAADSVFTLDPPQRIFARCAPLEVEVGAGKGDFIVERAARTPERNFLAIELSGSVFRRLALRCVRAELSNLRPIQADARSIVNLFLPPASISAFHIYFPDPWPKNRHAKHRLFSPTLVAGLTRALVPGGRLYVATDVGWYFDAIVDLLTAGGFRPARDGMMEDLRTSFGRKFDLAGRITQKGCFVGPSAPSSVSTS